MKLKNIVVDRGNSLIKAGFFTEAKLIEEKVSPNVGEILAWITGLAPEMILVSSVTAHVGELEDIRQSVKKVVELNKNTPLPFHNMYKTPETLGPDRLAGVAGAFALFPNQNCLVVDAGTCIKYDFIDEEGKYQGGAISPGLQMRLKALNHFTAKLPLVKLVEKADLTGQDTQTSILSGVLNGALAEVEGMIGRYHYKYKNLKVLICGGDINFFESKLKEHIFAVSNLVLIGLNRILLHNTKDFEADN